MATRGSPWCTGGIGVEVDDGAGVLVVSGAFVKIGVGGAEVVGWVEGPASEGVFCFFKHVPFRSIHRIVDWFISAPYFRVGASLENVVPQTSIRCVIIMP